MNSLNMEFMLLGIIDTVKEFFSELFKVLVATLMKPIYLIFMGVCKLLDLFELIAKKLAGMDVVYVNGSAVSGDLAIALLNNGTIWKAFTAMLALGSLLLFVSTFCAVIKSQMSQGEKRNIGMVVGTFIRSLINLAFVPALCFAGIYFGNRLLIALDAATNQTGANTVSSVLFKCAGHDANKARDPSSDLYKKNLGPGAEYSQYNTFGGKFSDSGSGTAADAIDNAFINNETLTGAMQWYFLFEIFLGNPYAGITSMFGILGNIGQSLPESEESGTVTFSIYNTALVCMYYNLASFNYVIGIGAGIILLKTYLDLIFGLIKRLYTIVTLFVIVPPIIGIYPIDEGRAMNNWKSAFVGNVISAYGAVVCINIYLMLMGVFQTVELFQAGSSAAVRADEVTYVEAASSGQMNSLQVLGINLANKICQTFIIIGGAMFLKQMIADVSRIIGANDAVGEGAGVSHAIQQGVKGAAKKTARVAATVASAGAGAALAKGASAAEKLKAQHDRQKQLKELVKKKEGVKDPDKNGNKEEENKATQQNTPAPQQNATQPTEQDNTTENTSQTPPPENKDSVSDNDSGKNEDNANNTENSDAAKTESKHPGWDNFKTGVGNVTAKLKSGANIMFNPVSSFNNHRAKKKIGKLGDLSKDADTAERVKEIEQNYQDRVAKANAYNPVKNPIKARLRAQKEKFINMGLRGLSGEDQQAAREYYGEHGGRRAAMRERQREMRRDYDIAKRMGDTAGAARMRKEMTDYMKAIRHGLERNDEYWKQEIAFQQSFTRSQQTLNNLQQQMRALQSTGQDTSEIKRQVSEMQSQLRKIEAARPSIPTK